jgi:RNA polymerase sigma-70 factor (ECF subfamily)
LHQRRRARWEPLLRRRAWLTAILGCAGYAEAAAATGRSVGAVKVAVHRLRRRYRELLWDEAARTVDAPEAIKDEVRELMAALGR